MNSNSNQNQYIMAVDQGTTSSRALIFNQKGQIVSVAQRPFDQLFPKAGWVEHRPEQIWSSVLETMKKSLLQANIPGKEIAAIGITNQRETIISWDRRTGQPLYNAIVWQCRRTAEFCNKIEKNRKNLITKKTGLVVDPYFSASKINWILKHVPEAKRLGLKGLLAVGTVDSFLLWNLTGGVSHRTDVSNASRTQLMNLQSGNWDQDLLRFFKVPESSLPEISDSCGLFGVTKGLDFLPDGVPISGIAGDQQAALFGQIGFRSGDCKITFGTGSFLLMNTGNQIVRSKHKLLSTVAWRLPKQKMVYALEGSVFVCGSAVQWLRDGLGLFAQSREVEELAHQVEDSGGVEFVPALTGLGAPYWNPEARGLITGLTRGSTKAHLARATLEAMALQNCDIIQAMEADLGRSLRLVRVDGGAVQNNLLMQIQADYLGSKVLRPTQIESTALGAAYLAGLGVGYWQSPKEIEKIWTLDREFKSEISLAQRKNRLKRWHEAIEKIL